MGNNVALPQYKRNTVPMSVNTVRVSEKQKSILPVLRDAMQCPSDGTVINLLTSAEVIAVHNHQHLPEQYIPTTDPKPFTVCYKYSQADKEALEFLKEFYKAPSRAYVVCHLINQAILVLNTKDGE